MLIAYDAGAFQQGISGGILNCAIGFLNAASQVDPSFEFVLIADPRIGGVKPEFIERLTVRPDVIYAEIGPSYDPPRRGLLTDNPDIRFVVDGVSIPAQREGYWAWYEGRAPKRSFAIASRSARPCDVSDSGDARSLGIPVGRITIDNPESPTRVVLHGDPQLSEGFFPSESNLRWTIGCSVLPLGLFPDSATVRVGVQVCETGHRYQFGGAFDRAFNRVEEEILKRTRRLSLSKLSTDLLARGAEIFFVNHFLPVAIPGLRLVAWVYDLSPVIFPRYFNVDALINFRCNMEVFKQADYLFSISEWTKRDILLHLQCPDERVIATGIDIAGDHTLSAPATVARVRQKYGISENYILCVGTIEPRKNHLRLVQAYHDLRQKLEAAPRLVIVGKLGWGYQRVLKEIRDRDLDDDVLILSEIDTEELSALYSGSLFVAYPSLYEGFGLPVLEAMFYHKPVLTSISSSLSEVAGDAARLVDPANVESISTGLRRLTSEADLRAQLIRRGDERRKAYAWPNIARRILDHLQNFAQK